MKSKAVFLICSVVFQFQTAFGRLGRSLTAGSLFGSFDWLDWWDSGDYSATGYSLDETKDEAIPDQFIVRFDDADSLSRVELEQRAIEAARVLGGKVLYVYEHVFKGAAIGQVPIADAEAEASLNSPIDSDVSFTIEQDRVVLRTDVPYVKVQAQAPSPLDRINQNALPLDGMYEYKFDGSGVTVFIMDTGIRSTHAELSDVNVTCGFNFLQDEDCDDLNGHGTHVAGIVASTTYGVAKGANLVNVKILNKNGSGSYAGIIAGIDYAIAQKLSAPDTPMIINMSLGGSISEAFNDATAQAVAVGIVVVVAAGNGNKNACDISPPSVDTAIAVGAAQQSKFLQILWPRDRRAPYSNYGSCVDIFAWGSNVLSLGHTSDTALAIKSGTSMAAPHVAGAAAQYLQRDPTLTPAQMKSLMMEEASQRRLQWLFQKHSPNMMLNTQNN